MIAIKILGLIATALALAVAGIAVVAVIGVLVLCAVAPLMLSGRISEAERREQEIERLR